MQNNIEKNQNTQLPSQVVADQSQLDLAISDFFKYYSLEDTENRIFRLLEEWIYDEGTKQAISSADDASEFISALKSLLDNVQLNKSSAFSAEIDELDSTFGISKTQELLDSLLQSWCFIKNIQPKPLDVSCTVTHCYQLTKFIRGLANEEGFKV